MMCPHCGYKDIIVMERTITKAEKIEGLHGKFFRPAGNECQLVRKDKSRCADIAAICGCPKCKKMFIESD